MKNEGERAGLYSLVMTSSRKVRIVNHNGLPLFETAFRFLS